MHDLHVIWLGFTFELLRLTPPREIARDLLWIPFMRTRGYWATVPFAIETAKITCRGARWGTTALLEMAFDVTWVSNKTVILHIQCVQWFLILGTFTIPQGRTEC